MHTDTDPYRRRRMITMFGVILILFAAAIGGRGMNPVQAPTRPVAHEEITTDGFTPLDPPETETTQPSTERWIGPSPVITSTEAQDEADQKEKFALMRAKIRCQRAVYNNDPVLMDLMLDKHIGLGTIYAAIDRAERLHTAQGGKALTVCFRRAAIECYGRDEPLVREISEGGMGSVSCDVSDPS